MNNTISGVMNYAVVKAGFNEVGEECIEVYALFSSRNESEGYAARKNSRSAKSIWCTDRYAAVPIKDLAVNPILKEMIKW